MMTTNSDGAQPVPGDQQQPNPAVVDAAAAAAGAAPQPQPDPDAPVDADEQALTDAKAAAEAEKAAGDGDDKDKPAGDPAKPAGQQQPVQAKGEAAGEAPVMIPKARLDEALARGDERAAEAAYWKGRADALATGAPLPKGDGQPGGPAQQQQPTADQRLADLQAQQDALAAKFDNGEITMADLTKQSRDLANKEAAIREETLLAKVKPAATQQPGPTDDGLYLGTLTAQLETQHPWCQVFNDLQGPDADAAWAFVETQARNNLVARGLDPTDGQPMTRYELRQEAAKLADRYGPALIGDLAKAKGIALPGQTPSQGGQPAKPALSPTAKARDAKLAQIANAPPNLNQMGGTEVGGADVPSDARLESMGEDEYDRLPEATRKRLLGTT
jgi:hypothetical protein